jgi:transglutaminase-like putative cysteine protease
MPQEKPANLPQVPLKNEGEAAKYLINEPQYQSAAKEIKELAASLTAGGDYWQTHQNILHYVYKSLKKSYVPAMANALDVLKIGKGDCTEHSTLYVALARAAGIPARQAVGAAYWPQGGGFGWHAWAEIWTGENWLAVDPTWDQEIADTTHWHFASGSMDAQVRISGLLGSVKIISAQKL